MEFLIVIFVCLVCGLIGNAVASDKGRSSAGFWLGFLLGPLGIIIALLLSPLPKKADTVAIAAEIADIAALIKNRGKIGVGISPKDGRTIMTVQDGSSAHAAGIKVGDRVVMIDGALCEGTYQSTVLRISGEAGTKVRLSLRRGDTAFDSEVLRQ